LWRELALAAAPSLHLAARLEALIGRLRAGAVEIGRFPPRVSIFGVSTLAPLYLRAFEALSRVIEVHLFVLAPSREYMSGTVSAREEGRLRRSGQLELAFDADLHLERGNPLVAAVGKLGREFQEVLEDVEYAEGATDLFVDPAPDPERASVLELLQSDALKLVERADGGRAAPIRVPAEDRSIEIQSCHSPMREVEVLHDRLLALFEEIPDLEPRDVVVMAPSIDDYAPYVEAVFEADRSRARIPFHLADRGPRAAERAVDAFFRILEVLRGRMTAPEVFDLLGMDVVRGRFGIEAGDLEKVRDWIARSGIRWGVDETHRARAGQPPIRENTWAFGLDRLFLGFAMPGRDRDLFGGVLPFDGVDGGEADLLGRLAEFCRTLFSLRDLPERPRSAARWAEDLGRALEGLVQLTADNADQHRRIRRALETLGARAGTAGFEGDIHLDA
ncbi:MAG: exodeoxyribonuclease V subunit gamma, partial [Candidatus Binatia bacterium]